MEFLKQLSDLPIQILDVAVICAILLSAFFAYFRGFTHEILSVSGWVGAITAVYYGLPYLRPYAWNIFDINQDSSVITLATDFGVGITIFILTLVFLSFFTRAISKNIQKSILGPLDRALGFLFGLARGGVLVCVIYLGLEVFVDKEQRPLWLTSAKSLELIIPGANAIKNLLPDESKDHPVAKAAEEARKKTQELLDAKSAVKNLISPKPRGSRNNLDGNYRPKELQDMERLIDSNKSPKEKFNK